MRDDPARLRDILEAAKKIALKVAEGKDAYVHDELVQFWLIKQFEVVGEASAKLTPELRASYPEVGWQAPVSLRNRLVHVYFDVDLDEVWLAAGRDLPPFADQIRRILDEIARS